MSEQRFKAWVTETKEALNVSLQSGDGTPNAVLFFTLGRAVVFALLTIAIAIHEAAEKKGK